MKKRKRQQQFKAFQHSFIDRRLRQRSFRSLWICRINGNRRQCGLNYRSSKSVLNRKILAQLVLYED